MHGLHVASLIPMRPYDTHAHYAVTPLIESKYECKLAQKCPGVVERNVEDCTAAGLHSRLSCAGGCPGSVEVRRHVASGFDRVERIRDVPVADVFGRQSGGS